MTCAGCGLVLSGDTVPTERGEMHRICRAIATMQARKPGTSCHKHGAELDETGWCPVCRLRVPQ